MLCLVIVGCGRVTKMFHIKAIDQISDLCIGVPRARAIEALSAYLE